MTDGSHVQIRLLINDLIDIKIFFMIIWLVLNDVFINILFVCVVQVNFFGSRNCYLQFFRERAKNVPKTESVTRM
jgi:hypothetical protein